MKINRIVLAFFCFLCSNLYATIWLNKEEICTLVSFFNEDPSTPALTVKHDIVPLRIKKIPYLNDGDISAILLAKGPYGFFVNLRDIFDIPAVRDKSEECKRKALRVCIDIYAERIRLGAILETCYECLDLPISLDQILVLLDIICTPINLSLELDIQKIFESDLPIKEKVLALLIILEEHSDLIDRNLLFNYIPLRKPSPYHKQLALHQFQALKKRLIEPEVDEVFFGYILNTLVDLLKVALQLHNHKTLEVRQYIGSLRETGEALSEIIIDEYPVKLWCNCDELTLAERIFFTAFVVSNFSRLFPQDTMSDINYISWGTGYFLQDCLIICQLLQQGYKNIEISLIDPIYDVDGREYVSVMQAIENLERLLIRPLCAPLEAKTTLAMYPNEEVLLASENILRTYENPTLITAVDILMPCTNAIFDNFIKKCKERLPHLHALTLNNHKIATPLTEIDSTEGATI